MTLTQTLNLGTPIAEDGDTCMWTIRRDGMFVCCGSAESYPEAFSEGLEASNDLVDWGTFNLDDPILDVALEWEKQTGPTTATIAGYTLTTGPV